MQNITEIVSQSINHNHNEVFV